MPDPFGLTDTGYTAKPLEQTIADLNALWLTVFGPNHDSDPDSADGQLIGGIAGLLDEPWQITEAIASIFDPQNAQGIILSRLIQLNGLKRHDEAFTLVTAEVTGTATKTLTAGAQAETTAGDVFALVNDVVFTGGADTSSWQAVEEGPVPCAAGTLTVITTPKPDWISITNAAGATEIGAFEEEDGAARERRASATEQGAVHMFTAMQSALRNVSGVTDAKIAENKTDAVDGLGLPEHSFRAIVEGGTDDDIAQAILDNHPSGIAWSGAESGNATDTEGTVMVVNFARPAYVDIHIEMTLALLVGFPSGGDTLIKQAIIDFAAGDLEIPGCEDDTDPQFYPGTDIGVDVLYSLQYVPIHSVPGHSVTVMTMNATGAPVTESVDIPMTILQKARFLIANIGVS